MPNPTIKPTQLSKLMTKVAYVVGFIAVFVDIGIVIQAAFLTNQQADGEARKI